MRRYYYSIRNYQPADSDAYIQLNRELDKLETSEQYFSTRVLTEDMGSPNYSAEQDLFIAETDNTIVGYVNVTAEVKIGRVILNCQIHPAHRGKALSTRLMERAMHRARGLGAKVAHVNVQEDNTMARIVLSKLGFEFVRRFLQLRLDISEVCCHHSNRTHLTYRHLQHDEKDKLAKAQNYFFADTWGYNPNTSEDISHVINVTGCSLEDIIITWDGDRIIGYCWTRKIHNVTSDEKRGQIYMLGVDPEYCGQGTGKAILFAGMSHLKSKGLQVAELTVDSENEAACALYFSAGFKVEKESLWYEKVID
ncbi:GNAT family N-acetyltransferase [Chloroflexota bacterium]